GALSSSQVVATFTDPGGAEATGDYSATIDWGDGTATTGADQITVSGGVFNVYGSHNYGDESAADHAGSSPYQVKVTIHHESAMDSNQVTITATVSDPPASAMCRNTALFRSGALSSSQVVATFTDPGGAEATGDYSATIDWGDGTATTGADQITVSGGV